MGRTACTEPQCLYKGAINPYLFKSGDDKLFVEIITVEGLL